MAKVIHMVMVAGMHPTSFIPYIKYQFVAVDPFNGIAETPVDIDLKKFTEAQQIELFEMFKLMNRTTTIEEILRIPNRRIETGDLIQQAVEATSLAIDYHKRTGSPYGVKPKKEI